MKHIIFFPGLGTDERLFRFIDVNGYPKHFVKWTKPAKKETLHSYLLKIKEQLTFDEPPILIGVSLGGMVAMEMREMIPVEKTIIISSVKTHTEMPGALNLVRLTNLNNFVPLWLAKKIALHGPILMGIRSRNTQPLIADMLADADNDFMRWAMQAALDWKRAAYDKTNLVHIHGTNDLVFPYRNLSHCHYTIKGGTHGMVMSRAGEINEVLRREIIS